MRHTILIVLVSLLVSGCYVQSLNVFYTDEVKVDLPELMGDWKFEIQRGDSITNKQITHWTFTANAVETYDTENTYSELDVVYFKVDGTCFMDFTAGDLREGDGECFNLFWSVGITPVHSLCQLETTTNTLTLIPLSYEWFTDRIEDETMKLSYVKSNRKDAPYIITATSEEWIAFLREYKDSEDVFNPKHKYVFTKNN